MERDPHSVKYLFQQEFSRMVAVISKQFGLQHIQLAEDIVSDTFLSAVESWGMKGLPEKPTAWLYAVARQKALYHLRRHKIFDEKVMPEMAFTQENFPQMPDFDFSANNIKDSQLRMLFAICNPVIASEAQIGLALRILCGFGIDEIAEAFLSNKETINKRLFRAKEKLRIEKIQLQFPLPHEISNRLKNVLHVLYLLFNEGYYSKTHNQILRKDMCLEAMRLAQMLTEYERTNSPETNALLSLMCFHASRFEARMPGNIHDEAIILYENQDHHLWDKELINAGMYYLSLSANGSEISSYHLEARIASWHCIKEDNQDKWRNVLHLYDLLLGINFSPSVALNRLYAFYKANGSRRALVEAEKLKPVDSHFYYVLLGEIYINIDSKQAVTHFKKAAAMTQNLAEKRMIHNKIECLTSKWN